MKERLQKILSAYGVCSRRAAETMISQGRVSVNGTAAMLGDSADPDIDLIAVDGVALDTRPKKVYIMLNKPRGYVTTSSDERGRRTVLELVSDCGARVYPVGRLDMQSEGLLFLTNDGEFANTLTHPSGGCRKVYKVSVRGNMSGAAQALSRPFELDGYITKPAQVRLLREDSDGGSLEITISEGRNRQIRRMCEKCGLEVRRLIRVSAAGIALSELPTGQWRYLTEEEVFRIFSEYASKCKNDL